MPIRPVWRALLRTNKMAHASREDSVDTCLGVRIPDGQAVTMAIRPKDTDAVQTHTSTHTLLFVSLLPTTPSSPYVCHKPRSPCIAAHPYVEPLLSLPHHPAMFPPLLDGYGHHLVHSSTCVASIRRACWCLSAPSRRQPSAGYQASIGEHRQADGLFRPLSPSHVSPLRHA